ERSVRVNSSVPASANRLLEKLMRQSAGRLPRAGRVAMRLGSSPLLERNLDWVTSGRRHRRGDLYGPRLAGVREERLLADLAAKAGELNGSTSRWLMHLDQIHYLPDDVLMKTDRASMLCSLE